MSSGASVELTNSTEEEEQIEKVVRCRQCDNEVTKPGFAIKPHEHTFRNPAGYSFHILCYSDAPGALDLGASTDEATWFPKHAWSFAECGQCRNHLGWWYVGPTRFVGLIATRVKR